MRGRLASGVMWSTIDSVASQSISLGIYVIIARLLSPEILGTVAACVLALELCRAVVLESIAIAVQVRPAPTVQDYNAAFMLIVGPSIFIAIILFIIGHFADLFFRLPGLGPIIQGFAVVIALQGLSRTHEAFLARNQQFRSLAIRSFLSVTTGGVVGVSLAMLGYGAMALVGQQIAVSLISFVALWSVTPWRPGLNTTRAAVLNLLRYARSVALTGLTNFANSNSDIMFVTWFNGAAGTGLYSLSKRLINAVSGVIGNALNRVFFSSVANTQHDQTASADNMINFVTYTSLLTAPLFTGIAVLSPEIVEVLFGAKWQSSGSLLAIMAVTGFLSTIGLYNHSVLLAFGKPHWQTMLTLIYAVSNILIFLIVAPFGLEAVALGYVGRAVLLYPLSAGGALYLLSLPLRRYILALVPSIACSAIMAAVILIAKLGIPDMPAVERVALLNIAGMATYAAAAVMIARPLIIGLLQTVTPGREG